jgi:hypothetical protein
MCAFYCLEYQKFILFSRVEEPKGTLSVKLGIYVH